MQRGGRDRTFPKSDRQRLILSVVGRKRVGTQFELQEALRRAGCGVTQATISRDIHELGLEKVHDVVGRPRYVAPDRGRRSDPREALERVLSEFAHSATAAQNLVVVQSELGSAPAIARALDRLDHPKIVGTLAGDDTCIAIARDSGDATALAAELGRALE